MSKIMVYCTVCTRSSDPINIVSYYIKWVPTSWTDGMSEKSCSILLDDSLCKNGQDFLDINYIQEFSFLLHTYPQKNWPRRLDPFYTATCNIKWVKDL